MSAAQCGVIEAELAHRARREILDDDVLPLEQRIDHFAALLLLHIERETALGRIEVREPRLVIETRRTGAAHLYVESREARAATRFDFDDVGAEIAENLRRNRADERPREIEHT